MYIYVYIYAHSQKIKNNHFRRFDICFYISVYIYTVVSLFIEYPISCLFFMKIRVKCLRHDNYKMALQFLKDEHWMKAL